MDLKQTLVTTIANSMGIDEMDVHMDSEFVSDLGADSLGTVELILELEDEFDIEISDEYAEKMLTVGDVYTYLDNNVDDRYIR